MSTKTTSRKMKGVQSGARLIDRHLIGRQKQQWRSEIAVLDSDLVVPLIWMPHEIASGRMAPFRPSLSSRHAHTPKLTLNNKHCFHHFFRLYISSPTHSKIKFGKNSVCIVVDYLLGANNYKVAQPPKRNYAPIFPTKASSWFECR